MVRNEFCDRIYLTPSASFLQEVDMGQFPINRDIVISFAEPHTGAPRSIYVNNPKYIKPPIQQLEGINLVPYHKKSFFIENSIVKIPTAPYISNDTNYKVVTVNDFAILGKKAKLFQANPEHIIVLHMARLHNTVYLSATKKIEDGLLHVERGAGVRNLSEDIADLLVKTSQKLLDTFDLDTAAVIFETDNRTVKLVNVDPSYIPAPVKQLYKVVIPQLIVPKIAAADPTWLKYIKLNNIVQTTQV